MTKVKPHAESGESLAGAGQHGHGDTNLKTDYSRLLQLTTVYNTEGICVKKIELYSSSVKLGGISSSEWPSSDRASLGEI